MRPSLRTVLAALLALGLLLALVSTAALADGNGNGRGRGRDGDRDRGDDEREDDERDDEDEEEKDEDESDEEEKEEKDDDEREPERTGRKQGGGSQTAPSAPAGPPVVKVTPGPGVLVVTVRSGGAFEATLPDVGSAWAVEAGDCDAGGGLLRCQPGVVVARAKVASPPGWAAEAEARAGNGAATAATGLLLL